MIIYGIHPITEALESKSRRLGQVLITRGKWNPRLQKIVELARRRGVPVRFETAAVLRRKVPTSRYQEAIAELDEIGFIGQEEILRASPTLLLMADGVEDPRNLGALLRTAEAAGVEGVFVPGRHGCGITPLVVKASAGAAMHLKIARVGNVVHSLKQLKKQGYWVIGLHMEGEIQIDQIDTSLPLVVTVGGEHRGVRRLVRKHCDFLVSLPMKGRVGSLNLSVAAGILLYQIVRGREGL